jgi:hypothetical protein
VQQAQQVGRHPTSDTATATALTRLSLASRRRRRSASPSVWGNPRQNLTGPLNAAQPLEQRVPLLLKLAHTRRRARLITSELSGGASTAIP